MTNEPQFFTAPDGTPMVILTLEEFYRLSATTDLPDIILADDADDADLIAAAREGLASLESEGGIPLEVERSIAAGNHPLIAWRKHRRWSQLKLAREAGLTQAAIARLEKASPGSGRPETLDKLADALDAPRWSLEVPIPQEKGEARTKALLDRANPPEQRITRAATTVRERKDQLVTDLATGVAGSSGGVMRTKRDSKTGEYTVDVRGPKAKGKYFTINRKGKGSKKSA